VAPPVALRQRSQHQRARARHRDGSWRAGWNISLTSPRSPRARPTWSPRPRPSKARRASCPHHLHACHQPGRQRQTRCLWAPPSPTPPSCTTP